MPFSIANKEGTQVLKLQGAVTIRHVADLAAKLGESLDEGRPVEVDTDGLLDVDTCILQLLYSLRKTVALSFDDPSDAFVAAVDRCGMRGQLLTTREAF